MSSVVLSGTQTIVNSKDDDDCKHEPTPTPEPNPEPEKECCCKTYNVTLHFH